MHTFLRDLTTLAAVAAAGGVALLKAFSPSAPPVPPGVAGSTSKGAAHAPISFAALAPGEGIHVRITSQGCFHDFDNLIVFSPAAGGADLTLAQLRADIAPGASFVTPDQLSRSQLQELDVLLEYYRSPRRVPRAACMTRDRVDVTLLRAGEMVAREYFTDATCGFQAENALTFGRLLRIVRRPAVLLSQK